MYHKNLKWWLFPWTWDNFGEQLSEVLGLFKERMSSSLGALVREQPAISRWLLKHCAGWRGQRCEGSSLPIDGSWAGGAHGSMLGRRAWRKLWLWALSESKLMLLAAWLNCCKSGSPSVAGGAAGVTETIRAVTRSPASLCSFQSENPWCQISASG